MLVNPKQIPDPENEGQMIDNPDYDPTKNEDGTPVEAEDKRTEVQKAIDEAKADMKRKLDAAYAARDDAAKKLAEREKADRDRETQRLKDEGKLQEAFERERADMEAKIRELEERDVVNTRDIAVSNVLAGYEFRNAKAAEMAKRDITSELHKNDAGEWVHRSGVTIAAFVKSFLEHDDNSFLLKAKRSSGGGTSTTTTTTTPADTKGKSLFGMSQADVLKLAAEGNLRKRA